TTKHHITNSNHPHSPEHHIIASTSTIHSPKIPNNYYTNNHTPTTPTPSPIYTPTTQSPTPPPTAWRTIILQYTPI
ncbi:hypothetical protein ACNQRS_32155, partial [Pseudomonas aeruginosa]|uniref:hypothetical protein n=1 Tax=Pseudomonas aeruginosa TaxID=287 RepID=UPI003F803B4E